MPSHTSNLAKELVKCSTNQEGLVDRSLVDQVLHALRELNPPKHLDILRSYLTEIHKTLRNQLVEIELGSELNDSVISEIKNKIKTLSSGNLDFNVSTNSKLIAGYRIRVIDDVFEDSVQSRLSKLSQSFTL
jgi:F0F1-type ATP synthase delta subunit